MALEEEMEDHYGSLPQTIVLQNKSLFPCGKHVSGIHRFTSLIHYSTAKIWVQHVEVVFTPSKQ